ncbi:unnamed protein product [Nezara viridula]|uniref:Uncharacterized protein n=1 Tax=Nezara viridula TaxID=85310 RepID=A0A9P0HJ85_NEZVI|nr:unnamed protein product [Nezara viridula]
MLFLVIRHPLFQGAESVRWRGLYTALSRPAGGRRRYEGTWAPRRHPHPSDRRLPGVRLPLQGWVDSKHY